MSHRMLNSAAAGIVTILHCAPLMAATFLADFSESVITGVIDEGTAIAFAPDGKLYVLEQDGTAEVYAGAGGGLWPQVAPGNNFFTGDPLDIYIATSRGLFGIAFDPDYLSNRYIYFYYTTQFPAIHNRIVRVTADAAGTQVVAGSRVVLMDLDNLNGPLHMGGAMHFGEDGKLYIAVGDNGDAAKSQSINSRLGKILRLNADPADPVPADNPASIDGIPGTPAGENRAIWAAGLRNPFTFAIHPVSGAIYINDVGEKTYEEINPGVAGANYGWNETEGPFDPLMFPDYTHPIVAYPRPGSGHPNYPAGLDCQGRAITGGTFYALPGATITFPSDYVNDYFFADFVDGWIRRYDYDANEVKDFAEDIDAPIDMRMGPDGALYYLARNADGFESGLVYRVQSTLPPCPSDLTDSGATDLPDGVVDVFDLFELLSSWNTAGTGAWLSPPLDVVDVFDLFVMLGAWGDC